MQGIKNKLITLRAKKALKNQIPRSNYLLKSSHRIAIVFFSEDEDSYKNCLTFVDSFKNQNNKELEVLVQGTNNLIIDSEHLKVNLSDFGFFGALKNEKVKEFLEIEFDYLFCLDKVLNPISKFILSETKARMRIGFHDHEAEDFFEMMIKGCGSLDNFTDTVLHYTQLLEESEKCVD